MKLQKTKKSEAQAFIDATAQMAMQIIINFGSSRVMTDKGESKLIHPPPQFTVELAYKYATAMFLERQRLISEVKK